MRYQAVCPIHKVFKTTKANLPENVGFHCEEEKDLVIKAVEKRRDKQIRNLVSKGSTYADALRATANTI